MQHAALESVSSHPKLTGTPFPAVLSPFDQYKVNAIPRNPPGLGFSALKKFLRVVANKSVNVFVRAPAILFSGGRDGK